MPTIVFRRQRGSPNSSAIEPSLWACFGSVASSCSSSLAAAFHRSGSLRRRKIGIASRAGARPIRNIARQALPMTPDSSSMPRPMPQRAASMLPTAESAWSIPSA